MTSASSVSASEKSARLDGVDHMLHIDAKEFLVLESIQRLFARLLRFGFGHQAVEFLAERRLRLDERRVAVVLQERQQVAMLAPKKIFPQKIAGAEQAGQNGKCLFVAEKCEGLLLRLALRILHGEVEKLVEGFQCFGRVRRPGQGMRELFDEHRGQAQVLLIDGIGQLLAVAIADVEAVA